MRHEVVEIIPANPELRPTINQSRDSQAIVESTATEVWKSKGMKDSFDPKTGQLSMHWYSNRIEANEFNHCLASWRDRVDVKSIALWLSGEVAVEQGLQLRFNKYERALWKETNPRYP